MGSFRGEWRAFANPAMASKLLFIGATDDDQPIYYEPQADEFWCKTRWGWEYWSPNSTKSPLTTPTYKSPKTLRKS